MIRNPISLKSEATSEIYHYIDIHLRKLPKNADGTINEFSSEFQDNDVDALRHAYVSGVFTQEYNEKASEIFGVLNEYFPGGGTSSYNSDRSLNMDLWNNNIGRQYGKRTKTRIDLINKLLKALKNDELIVDPNTDQRTYNGTRINTNINKEEIIIVLKESKSGKNLTFYDLKKNKLMERGDFISLIKAGTYPDYEIRIFKGVEIPASKKDRISSNNLG
jgi:hypothetical protein